MPDIIRTPIRMLCDGINVAVPVDRQPPNTFPLLSNVRCIEEGRIESRPGYSLYDNSASAPKLLHSMRRLNDPDMSVTAAGYLNVVGNGTIVEAGVQDALEQIDTGYSGNPLSLITFRPEQSPESWLYIYDQNKLIKVRPDAVTRPVGVAPPTRGPIIDYGVPAMAVVTDAFDSTPWVAGPSGTVSTVNSGSQGAVTWVSGQQFNTSWTGTIVINGSNYTIASVASPTALTVTTNTGSTGPVSYSFGGGLINGYDREAGAGAEIGSILYNSGTTGWACINPTSASPPLSTWWAGARMRVIIDGLGTVSTSGTAVTWVSGAQFGAGWTGTITINGVGYTISSVNSATSITLTATAGTQTDVSYVFGNGEIVAVREINQPISNTTIQGIQYDSGNTGACAIVLTDQPQGLVRNSLIQIVGGGGTEVVRVLEVILSPDGSVYSIRCVTAHNHAAGATVNGLLSWYCYTTQNHVATEPISITYTQVDTSLTAGVQAATLTQAINAGVTSNGRPIDQANDYLHCSIYVLNPLNIVNVIIQIDVDDGTFNRNYWTWTIPQDQLNLTGAFGTTTGGSWTEIVIPISQGQRLGNDFTKNFSTIAAVQIGASVSGLIGPLGFNNLYFFGTYGPVILPNSPVGYLYQTVDRDSTTGAESVPGPQTRYDVFPLREAVTVIPRATIAVGVDSLDIYRQGGNLTGFVYIGTVGNGTVNTNGTAVTWESGAIFSFPSTSFITINGVSYGISSVNSTTSITLSSSAGTQTGVAYTITFIDGVPDTSVLAAAAPDLTKIQPWPLLTLPWSGIVNVVGTSVEWVSGTQFNTALLSATVISINGVDFQTYGEPRTATFLELFLDAGVQGNVPYLIASPTLAGQPLPYAFGPLEGPLAPVVFGLGDPVNGGNLYWTNFSDGDLADDANFLELTPPSEPLISGQVWNGIVICGSRDNIFLVRYSFISNSVYQFNRIPSPSGMWTRWASCRGPDGVYYLGRDGIYLATEAGSKNITDAQLYPLFPHDGAPAVGSPALAAVDMTQTGKFMRLSAGMFEIFFDYLDVNGVQNTLRFDIPKQRWFPHSYGDQILSHYLVDESVVAPATPQMLLLGATSGNIYSSGGNTDNGVAVTCQAQVPYNDGGENRGQKLYVDGMIDGDGTGVLSATVSFNNGVTTFPSQNFTFAGSRVQQMLNVGSLTPLPAGLSLYRNISCLFSWTGGPAGPRLYVWEPSGYAMPYLSTSIVTQFLNLDFPDWTSHRRMYPALISTAPVSFTIITQDGRTYPFTIPSTNGQLRWLPQMLSQCIKDLGYAYSLTCPQPFALFPDDFTIEVKGWTEPSFIRIAIFKT